MLGLIMLQRETCHLDDFSFVPSTYYVIPLSYFICIHRWREKESLIFIIYLFIYYYYYFCNCNDFVNADVYMIVTSALTNVHIRPSPRVLYIIRLCFIIYYMYSFCLMFSTLRVSLMQLVS